MLPPEIFNSNPEHRFNFHTDSWIKDEVRKYIEKKYWGLRNTHTDQSLEKVFNTILEAIGEENLWYSTGNFFNIYFSTREMDMEMRLYAGEEVQLTIYGAPSVAFSKAEEYVNFIKDITAYLPKAFKNGKAKYQQSLKSKKVYDLNVNTITTLVKATMKGTGLKYNLQFGKDKGTLILCLDKDLCTKITLPFNSFAEKLPKVIPTIRQIKSLMEELGQPIRISGVNMRHVKWTDPEE